MPVGTITPERPVGADQVEEVFGKQGVGVQISHGREREAAAAANELATAFGFPLGQFKLLHQRRSASEASGALSAWISRFPSRLVRQPWRSLRSCAAKNSFSCSLIRSQGGLPSTQSKPPFAITSPKRRCQWKKRKFLAACTTACFHRLFNGLAAEQLEQVLGGGHRGA